MFQLIDDMITIGCRLDFDFINAFFRPYQLLTLRQIYPIVMGRRRQRVELLIQASLHVILHVLDPAILRKDDLLRILRHGQVE